MNDLDPIIDPEVLTAANRRHDELEANPTWKEAIKSEAAGEWSGKCIACGSEYQHLPANDEGVCANCGCHSVEQIINRIPLRPNSTPHR